MQPPIEIFFTQMPTKNEITFFGSPSLIARLCLKGELIWDIGTGISRFFKPWRVNKRIFWEYACKPSQGL